jgi:hypothetical protein
MPDPQLVYLALAVSQVAPAAASKATALGPHKHGGVKALNIHGRIWRKEDCLECGVYLQRVWQQDPVALAGFSTRTGAGADKVADKLNDAERQFVASCALMHVDHVNKWYDELVITAVGEGAWNKMPMLKRRSVSKQRVAFLRTRGRSDKVGGIVELLERSTTDATGSQVMIQRLLGVE